jgi:hypothetical protein
MTHLEVQTSNERRGSQHKCSIVIGGAISRKRCMLRGISENNHISGAWEVIQNIINILFMNRVYNENGEKWRKRGNERKKVRVHLGIAPVSTANFSLPSYSFLSPLVFFWWPQKKCQQLYYGPVDMSTDRGWNAPIWYLRGKLQIQINTKRGSA